MKESYQNPNKVPVSSNTIVAYAFTWAIGMVILAVALMVSVARAVRTTPQSRAEATIQAQKVLLYYPGMMLIPAVVKLSVDTAMGVAEGITAQSGASFSGFLDSFGSVMTQDPLSLVTGVLGGGVAALLLLLPTLLFMLMWLVTDIAAQFGAQLLMIVLPITFALGMFPNAFKRWSARATGFLLGCILTPVVTRFVFWVMWSIGGDMLENVSQNIFHSLLIIFVVITIGTSAPIGLAYVMPMVLDRTSGVYGGGGGSSVRPGQELVDKISGGVRQRLSGSAGGGDGILDKAAADQAGSAAVAQAKGGAAASGGAAGGGAAAGGGSAAGGAAGGAAAGGAAAAGALGVLGAAVLAAQQVGEVITAASKNAASMQLQGGGGHTNDASTGAPRIGGGHGASHRGGTGPRGYQVINEPGAVSSEGGGSADAPDDSGIYVPDAYGAESDWTPGVDYVDAVGLDESWATDPTAPSSPDYLEPEDVAPVRPERVVPLPPQPVQPRRAVPPSPPQGTVRLSPPRNVPGPKYTPPPPRTP